VAQPYETGDQIVTADGPISELLAAPLSPDWTIEGLAEQILSTIVSSGEESQEFTLVEEAITDRQSRRMIRPLLACLAHMSAEESGGPVDVFGGSLLFKREGLRGPVTIVCEFLNKQGNVRLAFRRSSLSTSCSELTGPAIKRQPA
jgi:hypothetical protein